MDTCTKYDLDQMMEEFRINGFVVFEDLIPHEKIDRILEAWRKPPSTPLRSAQDRGFDHAQDKLRSAFFTERSRRTEEAKED